MGQARPKNRAVLIVEDDAELRHLTAALFEDEQMDTIECESAEAALATLLIGGRDRMSHTYWLVLLENAQCRQCNVM
jgi:CheY-like chemotaxis protein